MEKIGEKKFVHIFAKSGGGIFGYTFSVFFKLKLISNSVQYY